MIETSVFISESDREMLRRVAESRHALHMNDASSRPFSRDYEYIGLVGEWCFGELIEQRPDLSIRREGDAGVDFKAYFQLGGVLAPRTIDVKTAEKPWYLLVEPDKVRADVYVLSRYYRDTEIAECLGWAPRKDVEAAPLGDKGGRGLICHYIRANELRPMPMLLERHLA